ncbi:hypothetical protein [Microvirga sp. TS319]|uniref:hypothetical protein n=1 Tax=Microvirga sp. TS319 TaxID=3241165 RepID=UPI00351A2D2C
MFGLDKLTSGKDGRDAAKAMSDVLVNTRDSALQSIDRGTNRAVADLGRARDVYRGAQRNQLDALRSGYDTARDYGQRAYDAFTPYTNAGRNAFSQYQDAIGMNGADGRTRALSAFQAGPGYQWQVDQASDAAARKASALGLTASGNTLDAITRLGSNLANQEYGSYLDRLNGVAKLGYDATGQQAGALRDLGNLATNYGTQRANVYGQTAGNIGHTYGQQAGYRYGAGNTGGQLIANIGQGLANAASQNELAGQQAAANRAGLLMSGLQLGASVLGGGFGGGMGGGMGGGLGSLFGGGKI